MNTIKIINNELQIKEYKGQRVVTLSDIDLIHERADGTAKRNFNSNKDKFIKNEDYYFIKKNQMDEIRTFEIPTRGIIALTESGYLMLVKSFTDDLAWQVQRALVKTYFNSKQFAKQEQTNLKEQMLKTREENVKVRKAQLMYKLSQEVEIPTYKAVLQSHITEMLTGEMLLPLPKLERMTFSAKEIGSRLGISGAKVGRLTNQYNLKTDEYGIWVWDKSANSAKQVQSFRYYDNILDRLSDILAEVAA